MRCVLSVSHLLGTFCYRIWVNLRFLVCCFSPLGVYPNWNPLLDVRWVWCQRSSHPPWDLIEKERAFGVLFVSTLFIIPIYSEGPASFGSDSEL